MMKKVLIISGSMRTKGNSAALAQAFAEGAAKNNQVETISLADKDIKFCKGCLACVKTNKCVIKDDMAALVEKVKNADVLVFASPVYYYSICGQLKTFLDRCNPLFTDAYRFREVYALLTAAEDEDHTSEGAEKAVQGWVDCFDGVQLKKMIFAGGVTAPGDIKGHAALAEAFAAGAAV